MFSLKTRLYGLLNNRCPSCSKHQELMSLNTSNIFMKRASWKKTQPVGNSDKLEKKAMSFFEKEKPYDLMMSTLYILLKAAD